MVSAIADYCRETGQPEPDGPPGYARAILESLAFKYRVVLESMEELTGIAITEIRIVGGGSRNRLLNQFTADAPAARWSPARSRRARSATSRCRWWRPKPCRRSPRRGEIIEHSFPVERFEPVAPDAWNAHYRRFHEYLEPTCV